MGQALRINHELAEVVIMPSSTIDRRLLKKMILATLDQYKDDERIPAQEVHRRVRRRHGADYQSPGYYLRLYRQRADWTQAALAKRLEVRQHHLSEMEHNKRPIGKAMARKLSGVLDCDYRKFL